MADCKAAVSSDTPSPLAPADFTLTKDEDATLSYWGLERSKILESSMRIAGLVAAVNGPWIVVLEADAAALAHVAADAEPSSPVVYA